MVKIQSLDSLRCWSWHIRIEAALDVVQSVVVSEAKQLVYAGHARLLNNIFPRLRDVPSFGMDTCNGAKNIHNYGPGVDIRCRAWRHKTSQYF